jgi:hypothetical protein
MYRAYRLVIRLNKTERAAIDNLARVERLPASTLARRLLLREADRHGLNPSSDMEQIQQAGKETCHGD